MPEKKSHILLIIILAGIISGSLAGSFFALTKDLPQIRELENFNPSSVTRVFSSDNTVLAELYIEKRVPVSIHAMPEMLRKAIVTTEDRKFYDHSGVDIKGIARAFIKNIVAGKFVEGASTITQQLSKTLFLTPEKKISRKIKEAILSFQLERRYTKDEILELYLNQVYFGSGAYGVEAASRIFFGKNVQQLTLAECALIAGMPKAPSYYSPLVSEERAVKRRNIVLKQMFDTGIISAGQYRNAMNAHPDLSERKKASTKAPYFIDYIKAELENEIGSDLLYKGGLTVLTTLDFNLQKTAEKSIGTHLDELKKRMLSKGIDTAEPEAGVISIDVETGAILAMAGGSDYGKSPYNRAVHALRQPGSAFKPVLYALAAEQGFPQNTTILDSPVSYKIPGQKKPWEPSNFSKDFKGEMTFRKALALSKNIPAVRLMEKIGPTSVIRFASDLGISSPLTPNLSLALGTSETRLIELTNAYAVFPAKGMFTKTFGITEITDRNGITIHRAKPVKRMVMSRAGAAVITDMLTGVIREGTGRRAGILNCSVGGKTGTTDDSKDALFIGFSPSVCTGVWVGCDLPISMGKGETGARAALPIWTEIMTSVCRKNTLQYFDLPDDTVFGYMNPNSGQPAEAFQKGAVKALFIKGTEPHP